MSDETDRYKYQSQVKTLIDEIFDSEYFKDRLAGLIDDVMEKRAEAKRWYPKKDSCTRGLPPHNTCRPMVSVMMVPIPFFNPFWWAESCLPRPCPTMPTCCHHGSYPMPPARHPETTGGTRAEHAPSPK